MIVPLLLLQNDSSASASSHGGAPAPGPSASSSSGSSASSASSGAAGGSVPAWKLASQTKDQSAGTATSSTTTTPPTTVPPTTTTAPPSPPVSVPTADVVHRSAPVPTATVPPTTTTTAPTPSATGSVHYGQVTYYAHPAGTCASPFLPFGTVVRVTNPANGLSVTCLVNDREADTARSIDLATATFALLAPLSQGVINAQLTW